MISGYLSEANGGSFTAGWLGGQVAGAFSLIPGMGWAAPVVGTFTGSVVTDYVDYGWNGINWRKAIVTGIIAGAINYSPVLLNGIATDWGVTDATFVLTNAYNGFYTSTASSILNAFWRDNK